jgi:hypothetical protein
MLKCYDCSEDNKVNEAVGVCIVCGKGLCIQHIKQIELPMKGGYPLPHLTLKKDLPRMMCVKSASIRQLEWMPSIK